MSGKISSSPPSSRASSAAAANEAGQRAPAIGRSHPATSSLPLAGVSRSAGEAGLDPSSQPPRRQRLTTAPVSPVRSRSPVMQGIMPDDSPGTMVRRDPAPAATITPAALQIEPSAAANAAGQIRPAAPGSGARNLVGSLVDNASMERLRRHARHAADLSDRTAWGALEAALAQDSLLLAHDENEPGQPLRFRRVLPLPDGRVGRLAVVVHPQRDGSMLMSDAEFTDLATARSISLHAGRLAGALVDNASMEQLRQHAGAGNEPDRPIWSALVALLEGNRLYAGPGGARGPLLDFIARGTLDNRPAVFGVRARLLENGWMRLVHVAFSDPARQRRVNLPLDGLQSAAGQRRIDAAAAAAHPGPGATPGRASAGAAAPASGTLRLGQMPVDNASMEQLRRRAREDNNATHREILSQAVTALETRSLDEVPGSASGPMLLYGANLNLEGGERRLSVVAQRQDDGSARLSEVIFHDNRTGAFVRLEPRPQQRPPNLPSQQGSTSFEPQTPQWLANLPSRQRLTRPEDLEVFDRFAHAWRGTPMENYTPALSEFLSYLSRQRQRITWHNFRCLTEGVQNQHLSTATEGRGDQGQLVLAAVREALRVDELKAPTRKPLARRALRNEDDRKALADFTSAALQAGWRDDGAAFARFLLDLQENGKTWKDFLKLTPAERKAYLQAVVSRLDYNVPATVNRALRWAEFGAAGIPRHEPKQKAGADKAD